MNRKWKFPVKLHLNVQSIRVLTKERKECFMAMTRKMLKACVSLTTDCSEKESKSCGAFMDAKKPHILCIVNRYGGCIINDNITDTDKQEILTVCNTIKSIGFCKFFEPVFNKEFYPNDWVERLCINDVQKLITVAKKTEDWKKHADIKVMLQRNFNSCYDRRLFVKIARCIDGQRVTVHYPVKANQPIILSGKYGMGLVLPVMR